MKTELREDMLNISVLGLERPVSVSMLVQPGARGLVAARIWRHPREWELEGVFSGWVRTFL